MKFFDLTAANEELSDALDSAYHRVMKSGWVILGPELQLFESEFAAFCETSYCIGVGNGLDALALALRAKGIGAGDEVIVPSHTFIATWLAVSMVGARPVPVEVDDATFTMDPERRRLRLRRKLQRSSPFRFTGIPSTWSRSSPWPSGRDSSSWRTRRRRTARGIKGAERGPWLMQRRSASTRPRISAPLETAERSLPRIRFSRIG